MYRTRNNESITVFPGSGPHSSHEVFIMTSPVMIDQETDHQECQGMPFYSPSRIPPGITDLSDLIEYCRQGDRECAVICNQKEFTQEYIRMIQDREQGSKWKLYIGHCGHPRKENQT